MKTEEVPRLMAGHAPIVFRRWCQGQLPGYPLCFSACTAPCGLSEIRYWKTKDPLRFAYVLTCALLYSHTRPGCTSHMRPCAAVHHNNTDTFRQVSSWLVQIFHQRHATRRTQRKPDRINQIYPKSIVMGVPKSTLSQPPS